MSGGARDTNRRLGFTAERRPRSRKPDTALVRKGASGCDTLVVFEQSAEAFPTTNAANRRLRFIGCSDSSFATLRKHEQLVVDVDPLMRPLGVIVFDPRPGHAVEMPCAEVTVHTPVISDGAG